jgi:hypothetical protein
MELTQTNDLDRAIEVKEATIRRMEMYGYNPRLLRELREDLKVLKEQLGPLGCVPQYRIDEGWVVSK